MRDKCAVAFCQAGRILQPLPIAACFPAEKRAAERLHTSVAMKEPSDARKRTLALQERALKLSTAVNAACPGRCRNTASTVVWDQLVRAADSASSNLLEADDASSTADFVHKMKLALREVKESKQCLAKIRLSKLDGHDRVDGLEQEADELAAIFATIVMKVKNRGSTETSQFTPGSPEFRVVVATRLRQPWSSQRALFPNVNHTAIGTATLNSEP